MEGKGNMERLTKAELVNGFPVCYPNNCSGLPEFVTKGNPYRNIVERLKAYEDLEEQGKLLKLEDKYQKIMIGQEIFVVEDGDVKPRKICRINEWWNDYHGFQGEYAAIPSKCFGSWEFKYEDFGKTVFLAREEAEATLKELRDKKG